MNIQQYSENHQNDKATSDILSRWEGRIVAEGLHRRGRAGAEDYLARYGRGLAEKKALGLAAAARQHGCPELHARFIEEAFFLATGQRELLSGNTTSAVSVLPEAHNAPRKSYAGTRAQLLTALPREEAFRLLRHPMYGVQEKIDGERCQVITTSEGEALGGNKLGLARVLPLNIAEALGSVRDSEFDGEHVRSTNRFHVFDLLRLNGADLRSLPLWRRHDLLVEACRNLPSCVEVVPLVQGTPEEVLSFVNELEARSAEGFVLKQLEARYQSGDTHGTQFKFQFRAQIAVVAGQRNGSKNSVGIHVFRPDGSVRELGSVTIPASEPIPQPGTIIEVRYLYCHPGPDGRLAQPVYLGERDDVRSADCTDDKIKVKAAA